MQESYLKTKIIEDNFIVDRTLGRDIKFSIELLTKSTFDLTLTGGHNSNINTPTDFFRTTWTELGVCNLNSKTRL